MNKPSLIKQILLYSVISSVCMFTNNAAADCDSTANTYFPSVVPPNYYGNSATDSFNCAVRGDKQLSIEQINERADLIPPNLNNRFYIMIGANAAAEAITRASNNTDQVTANNLTTGALGTLSTQKNSIASNNFEIGFGYTWTDFAFDIEWLAVKSIPFTAAEINITPSFTFTSTVKGDTLLGNIYWFFNDMYNIKLYGVLSVGYVHNQSTTQIGTGPVTVMNRYYPDGGLGIGGRFNIFSKLYADIAGRFIVLGPVKMSANNGVETVYVKAWRTWLGASVRLLWLI